MTCLIWKTATVVVMNAAIDQKGTHRDADLLAYPYSINNTNRNSPTAPIKRWNSETCSGSHPLSANLILSTSSAVCSQWSTNQAIVATLIFLRPVSFSWFFGLEPLWFCRLCSETRSDGHCISEALQDPGLNHSHFLPAYCALTMAGFK